MSTVPTIAAARLETVGAALSRPECVLPMRSGDVFVPEWPGGVTVVRASGQVQTWRARTSTIDLRPNGIALTPDGSFLIANLGNDGGVWRLDSRGELTPFVIEVDGIPVPPANFVTIDDRNRIWITVSTRHQPRQLAWRRDVADGFVALVDGSGPRIVADGLHYTNEVRVDPSGNSLCVVETFGRRIRRFEVKSDGSLGTGETVLSLDTEFFPDGLAFDEAGGLWVTSLVTNRLLRLHDDRLQTVLEDVNRDFVRTVEQAFVSNLLAAEHLGRIPGTTLQQLTSIGFGGRDGKSVYLGTLHGSSVYGFRTTVAGANVPYWSYPAP
jgi:sugar lactone lactonase YvrE